MEQNDQLAQILEDEAVRVIAKIKGETHDALADVVSKYKLTLNTDGHAPTENVGKLLFSTDARERGRIEADCKKSLKETMVTSMLTQADAPKPPKPVTKKKATKKKTGGK